MQGEDRYLGRQIGNYRITSALNSGTFGRVYKGEHIILTHRVVAIKILYLNYLGSSEEQEAFLQEAQFLEMLKHTHILPIYDVGIDDEGFPYLVAELAANGSLRDLLRFYQKQKRLLPLKECLRILSEVGEALQYVHQENIVHRDLKPENILFDSKNAALIADFGVAVFLETTRTKYANATGSPLYMAPEQFEGLASRRSDQYALACVAYEMLAGRPPFNASHPLALGMKHQNELPPPPSRWNPRIPQHIEQAILKALAKQREDRYPDITSFIQALLEQPAEPIQKTKEDWLEEGYVLFNKRQYEDALAAFDQACKLDPSFADAHEGRGTALFSLFQNPETDRKNSENMIRHSAPPDSSHYNRAIPAASSDFVSERMEEALEAYERAIQLNPSYAAAFSGKGNILFASKNYVGALQTYEHAISLDPSLVDAYIGKGNTLYYLGRYDEAIRAYDAALRLDSDSVAAYDGKGWAFWHNKRYQAALEAFDQAARLDPRNVSPLIGKGRSLYSLSRFEEALACFRRVLALDPKHVQAHEYAADTLYFLQRYEEALKAYETAIELDPHLAAPLSGKGRVLYELGSDEEALAAFEEAIRINPHLASAYNGRGKVFMRFECYEDALGSFERAVELQPRIGAFYYNKAEALRQLEHTSEAEEAYEQARQLGYKG